MTHTTAPERTRQRGGMTSRNGPHDAWTGPLLRIENLGISFGERDGGRPALCDVSFDVKRRECVGIIGEAGAGKTLAARSLHPQHLPVDARMEGRILLNGDDVTALPHDDGRIRVLTRDPMEILNPVRTVGQQLTAALRHRHAVSDSVARELAVGTLDRVGVPAPWRNLNRYPHHFSGTMRYRVMAAAVTISEPELLVVDQPVGLDASAQEEFTALLCKLASEAGSAVLLLSREPSLIAHHCQRLVCMHAGEILETGRTDDLLQRPAHPYTAALLANSGGADGAGAATDGCLFRHRCPHAIDGCERTQPLVVDQRGRRARCWRHGELYLKGAAAG